MALQFLVHLIVFLSILLIRNGFSEIQKAVVDQRSSRLPNSDCDLFFFFGTSLTLGGALELRLSPTTELVVDSCIKSTFRCISQTMKQFAVVAYNKRR